MSPSRVPVRHSLVTRLLATSVLIAVAAIATTAWLATQTATRAIRQEQGRSLTDDKGVYDMLIGYAAAHPDWSGAHDLIASRAAELGRRITLMTPDRQVIVESGPGPSLRNARPSAVVDPLDLDLGLTGGTSRIDERVVGPFQLPDRERNTYLKWASDQVICMAAAGVAAAVVETPGGRAAAEPSGDDPAGIGPQCLEKYADNTTATERKALRALAKLTGRCLDLPADKQLYLRPDLRMFLVPRSESEKVAPAEPMKAPARAASCLEKSRKIQFQPYVAPAALLFVTDPDTGDDFTTFTLSRDNVVRIAGVTAAVLLATILVTVLVGRRLIRPLRALTEAADGQAPVPSGRRDEIGRLAQALNDSAGRRDRAEAQRRAMVSDVAHELRTPLTNIRSWLEAAQDDLAPTDGQLLTLLHEEAVQLQHIIDDLSDLAAGDAGTLRMHRSLSDVRELLGQVVESHRGTAQAADVRLTLDVAGDPVIDADPVRLKQIVGNLVSNAIRYTPSGGAVTVAASGTTITVQDTGVGIPADDLPKIFDRFWRADQSRSRATGGSGLGLAITRKLVEAHGGTVAVHSTPGQGTVFTVDLGLPS
ncbi:sensor histidine kinase [Actinoplanes derwentensis]|uniref:histidine kinase n=1 Tax=Actinoplanes derwentensis TaxID=113562 RepID=A0A1H1YUG1_9ACTN|nr:HAMP domain-containing sensor histidine kinase [Actinoplanes derwentensis]GID81279.1 two-component sensor histidine kinase [Actinoplanes derwentensis]SDT24656.1 two-component system, OmpR family, sensor histidine kinase BaeS [Actinoplanes derwentensis]